MTAEEVRQKVASGEYKSSDFAWKEGMANWSSIADAGVLAEASLGGARVPAPTPAVAQSVSQPVAGANPYAAPVSAPAAAVAAMPMEYPGIGRLKYFFFGLLIWVAMIITLITTMGGIFSSGGASADSSWMIFLVVLVAALIGAVFVMVKRLVNLGMSG